MSTYMKFKIEIDINIHSIHYKLLLNLKKHN